MFDLVSNFVGFFCGTVGPPDPTRRETFLCSVRQSVFSVGSSYKNSPFAGYPSDPNFVYRVAGILLKKIST